eukprot:CAMPEP_0206145760 /NCGR_PEP_ID=MMETSP1473-20131121/28440_1 /ASSEMBLY_ACC=CAM_ASM_001109 /TAXON_ID=1461547 /ORGANISM="Stichococcus sp, Strain RCC1054" /LENGTH=43 /DNA_ID= /DNA_START= /DNA_END= /DNA_ORIENTATION=
MTGVISAMLAELLTWVSSSPVTAAEAADQGSSITAFSLVVARF